MLNFSPLGGHVPVNLPTVPIKEQKHTKGVGLCENLENKACQTLESGNCIVQK